MQRAWTPYLLESGASTDYGYGWAINPYQGHTFVQHGGGINGFITYAIHVPEKRVYVAVLGNSTSPATQPRYIAFNLAALAIGKPYVEPEAIALGQPAIQKFVGRYAVVGRTSSKIIVTSKGTQLFVQFAEEGPLQDIDALSSTEFFIKDSMLRLRFVPASAGKGVELQLRDQDVLLDTAVRGSK